MRCPNCGEAEMVRVVVPEYNVGSFFGLTTVNLTNAPIYRCDHCSESTIDGGILDVIGPVIADAILAQVDDIDGEGARFLRKFMGLTQEELAGRMRVSRDTVLRWEKSQTPLAGPEAIALCQVVRRHQMREVAERIHAILEAKAAEATSRFCDLVVSRKQLGVLYAVVGPEFEGPCLFSKETPGARRPLRIKAPSDVDDCSSASN